MADCLLAMDLLELDPDPYWVISVYEFLSGSAHQACHCAVCVITAVAGGSSVTLRTECLYGYFTLIELHTVHVPDFCTCFQQVCETVPCTKICWVEAPQNSKECLRHSLWIPLSPLSRVRRQQVQRYVKYWSPAVSIWFTVCGTNHMGTISRTEGFIRK